MKQESAFHQQSQSISGSSGHRSALALVQLTAGACAGERFGEQEQIRVVSVKGWYYFTAEREGQLFVANRRVYTSEDGEEGKVEHANRR
jgi:hypothetical protein